MKFRTFKFIHNLRQYVDFSIIRYIFFLLILLLIILFINNCKTKNINVIFISLDTTRYDFIDTGKGARAFTPEIKKFSKQALIFENAYTTIPQTLPAHLSAFTSYLPHEMGVFTNEQMYDGRFKMIQEILKDKGYYTASVISLGTLSSKTGINKGFDDFYEDQFKESVFFVTADEVATRAIELLKKNIYRKFFLFLHFSDPHSPYAPPDVERRFQIKIDGKNEVEFNAFQGAIMKKRIPLEKGNHTIIFKLENEMDHFKFFIIRGLKFSDNCTWNCKNIRYSDEHYGGSYIMDQTAGTIKMKCSDQSWIEIFQIIPILTPKSALQLYKQEVEYMDRSLGKVFRVLKEENFLNKTVVVIFADHGEGLGEIDNYFGHTRYLNRQFIHIPLMMFVPGIKGKRIKTPVSLTTITPTVLNIMKIQKNDIYNKSSLKMIKSKIEKNHLLNSFVFGNKTVLDKLSVIEWPYQSIFYIGREKLKKKEFYNLSLSNSFYKLDTISEDVLIKNSNQSLRKVLNEFYRLKNVFKRSEKFNIPLDRKTVEQLKTLGYINQ